MLDNLGNVVREQGDYAAARALIEEALAIRRELGNRRGIATSLNSLGHVAWVQGDERAAYALHEEALAIRRELGDRAGIASSLEGLAFLAGERQSARAARLWSAAARLREEIGSPLSLVERSRCDAQVAAVHVSMGSDAAFDSAWAEGRALTLVQAIELALEGSGSDIPTSAFR